MSRITSENFEEWMLRFVEDKLEGRDLLDFEDFILNHPDLKSDKDSKTVSAKDNSGFFEPNIYLKARMIRQILEEEEDSAFQYAEGTLDTDKKARVEKRMLTSPRLRDKVENFSATRIKADKAIVFSNKSALYKKSTIALPGWWPYAAAAVFALGLIIFSLNSFEYDRDVEADKKDFKPTIKQLQRESSRQVPLSDSIKISPGSTINTEEPPSREPIESIPPGTRQSPATNPVAHNFRKPVSREIPIPKRGEVKEKLSPAEESGPQQIAANVPREVPKSHVAGLKAETPAITTVIPPKQSVLFKGGKKILRKITFDKWQLEKYINSEGETVVGLYTPTFDIEKEKQ